MGESYGDLKTKGRAYLLWSRDIHGPSAQCSDKGQEQRMGSENMQNTGREDHKEQMTRKVGIQGTAKVNWKEKFFSGSQPS